MRTSLTTFLGLLMAAGLAFASAPAQSAGPAGQLATQLNEAITQPGWDADRWSVLVVSIDGGDTLFAHRPDAAMIPASNLKLFTTAAAMRYLGPGYRYSTFLTGTGPIRDGVLRGDLYLYGTGDPTLADRFFESKTAVWEALADSLAALGIRRVAGDLVGDATYFEDQGYGQGWQQSYVTHTYAAPTSALSFNENIVTMRVLPAEEAGAAPRIQLIPGGRAYIRNEATTTTSGRSFIEVEREGYDAPIVVKGQIRQGASAIWRAVPVVDPARFAATVFEEVLAKRGIAVDGEVRSLHDPAESPITGQKVFAPAFDEDRVIQVLAVHRSPPLQEILDVINQRSHNLYADAVLRTVGRVATGRGSVEGGQAAVTGLLEQAGPAGGAVRMDDGSGLSTLDRASARAIVELLAYMAESPYRDAYMATLPEAATSRGLRRMQQTPAAGNLRAKTGTIDRVSALSGYVRASNGELLAFAIVANDVPSTWRAKRIEDRIGARLAAFERPVPQRLASGERAPRPTGDTASAGDRPEREQPPTRADTAAAATAQEAAPEEETQYVIKRGDTLEGIARSNNTTVQALREANPGVNDRRLMPGESLTIPAGDGGG